jgi:hypothetical protein
MLEHIYLCDAEFGQRVADGIGVPLPASVMAPAD